MKKNRNQQLAFYNEMLRTGKHPITGKAITNADRINVKAMVYLLALEPFVGAWALAKYAQSLEVESVATNKGNSPKNSTEPSLSKGGKPKGNYAEGKSRGIIKQNETADILAREGYDITLLDDVNGGNGYGIKETSNPDWLIEDNVFDCYAPDPKKSIDNIIREMKGKTKSQAEYLVLNLDGFDQSIVDQLAQAIKRKSLPEQDLRRLKEVIFVKDGKIDHVYWRE
ncbi:hypothetical protein [uncultured Enterococcus sp.]|uniref:CdiA C-terminal domain-containing protein n=1 Tax=uncultured Enterococcus sp. TaxID=167972 RepID=UPI002AA620CF|nr:hypothetical protein [uncultured Enterococcus sp.]